MSSSEPFNTLGGYSVGIPPELVIDETGNIVNNVNAPSSNVTANRIFANSYLYANGQPLSIGASGSNTQVQYNNNGLLGASSAFTFNSATNLLAVTKLQVGTHANLGNVANVVILGGVNGYFLQTDGDGNLTWAPAGNGGNTGNGIPGGANTQVQFNDAGEFGGDAGFTYDKVANVLTVNELVTGNVTADDLSVNDITANNITANYFIGDGSNITNVAAETALVAFSVDGANVVGEVDFAAIANSVAGANVTGEVSFANVANNVSASNITGQVANALVAGTVYNSTQANITSVGNLTSLTVVGNTTLGNQVVANYFIGNLFGTANLARNVTLGSQPNITSVGTLTSLTVSGNTTLGNITTSNYFVGNLHGVANSAIIANTANVATLANTANYALVANISNFTGFSNNANFANVAFSVDGSNVNGQVANALVAGTVYTSAQPNITSVGTLIDLSVSGNISSGNVYANTGIVKGNILLGTLGTANQPNITSVGTLTSLSVSGNITAGNVNAGNLLTANFISGTLTTNAQQNINYLGNIGWLNVDTSVPNSNGNITFNGSMSGTGVGSNISITGNLNAGNYVEANYLVGILTSSSQPNITTIGNLTSLTVQGTSNLGDVANITILGGNANYVLSTDGAGNLSWVPQSNGGGSNGVPGGLNTQIQFNDDGNFGGDPQLTWNKTTNYMYLGGNANIAGILNVATTLNTVTLNTTGSSNLSGNVTLGNTTLLSSRTFTASGIVDISTSPNVNLGNVANIHITGGVNGYVLSTDGSGNLSWKNVSSNGGGNPGGSNTQIQYNDQGSFGGSPFFTFNENTSEVTIAGNLTTNAFQMGSGIYQFSKANVYFATTNSASPQVLLSIPADDLAAVDLTIISDDDSIRNFIKISAVVKGSTVNYAEYSTLPVNGYTGDFAIEYNAGNVIVEPTVQIVMTPQSANLMTHRMQVTTYYVY